MRELKNKLKKMKKVERERDVNEITRWVMSKWKEISEGEVNQDWRLKSALVKMVNTRFKVRDRRKMQLSDAQVDIGVRNWSQMSTISRSEHRRDRGETFKGKSKWCLANEHWRKELKSRHHNCNIEGWRGFWVPPRRWDHGTDHSVGDFLGFCLLLRQWGRRKKDDHGRKCRILFDLSLCLFLRQ